MSERSSEELGPQERRLLELLALLRAAPPAARPTLARIIVRRARWQHTLRGAFRAFETIGSAFVRSVVLLRRGRR